VSPGFTRPAGLSPVLNGPFMSLMSVIAMALIISVNLPTDARKITLQYISNVADTFSFFTLNHDDFSFFYVKMSVAQGLSPFRFIFRLDYIEPGNPLGIFFSKLSIGGSIRENGPHSSSSERSGPTVGNLRTVALGIRIRHPGRIPSLCRNNSKN